MSDNEEKPDLAKPKIEIVLDCEKFVTYWTRAERQLLEGIPGAQTSKNRAKNKRQEARDKEGTEEAKTHRKRPFLNWNPSYTRRFNK